MPDIKTNTTKDTIDTTGSDDATSSVDDSDIDNKRQQQRRLDSGGISTSNDDDSDDDDSDDSDNDNDNDSDNNDTTDDNGTGDNSSISVSALSSDGGAAGTATATAKVDNPFHTLDFNALQQRRERARKAKLNEFASGIEAALHSLDQSRLSIHNPYDAADNNTHSSNNNNKNDTKFTVNNTNKSSISKKNLPKIKPNLVVARSKNKSSPFFSSTHSNDNDNNNTTNTTTSKGTRNFNWFAGSNTGSRTNNNNGYDQKISDDDIIYEDVDIDMEAIDIGKRSIAIWPYDEYHMIQESYWNTVKQFGKDFELYDPYLVNTIVQQNSTTKVKYYTEIDFNILHENLLLQSRKNNRPLYFGQSNALSIPIFSRPYDPPDLSQQVSNLTLTKFEEVAVERAISVISTWLFDVGLVDELLTNGGIVGRTTAAAVTATALANKKNNTTTTSNYNKRNSSTDSSQSLHPHFKNRNSKKSNNRNMMLFDELDDSERSNDADFVLNEINKAQAAEDADDLLPTEEYDISKMDKEITKIRNSTRRTLALINARLEDSVKAIGSEVQELVNAVIGTKDDIGRLRDLSSYIHNAGEDEQTSQQFMLTKYPKLKQAINARRNLVRVFRELDFFSQIPVTCDRLREEMHDGEWTEYEFSSLRSVAREHVDLEIFLIEAEAGMKRRIEIEEAEYIASKSNNNNNNNATTTATSAGAASRLSSKSGNRQNYGNNNVSMPGNYALIDRFLEEHVKNVWDMGEEISIRIMNGIGNAFELSLTNPAGMVALVEAVEVYESANEDYKTVHGEEAGKRNANLQFTGMRAQALAELYRDFEARCTDVFTELSMQNQNTGGETTTTTNDTPATTTNTSKGGTETPEDEEASNKQFSSILRAANELGSEITIVNEKMAPCFPDNWAITTLWTTCVAHVCSTNILQQIGGTDGQNLPDLSLKQLLDLVAWVETFRQTISEIFPLIAKITASKRSYLDKPPKLLVENSKMIDIALAEDSLVWVNNTLLNIHNMAKDEFLFKTKEMAEIWLERGYTAEREVMKGSDGKYRTAFSEDVYSMTSIHLRTIRERLTRRSEALVQAVGVVFKILYDKQSKARDNFCTDFPTCCAAANDFLRMSEKCEEIVDEIKQECNLSSKASEILEEQSAALLGVYSGDAVFAAKKTQTFCLSVIEEEVANELFSVEWEEELLQNETAHAIVSILDDCMTDVESGLDELMVSRAAEAQVTLVVNFYINTLQKKGGTVKGSKSGLFKDNEEAIQRMRDDIEVLKKYFRELSEDYPTLGRITEDEFTLLESIFELLEWGASYKKGDSNANINYQLKLKECIAPLQKRIKNVAATKYLVTDLLNTVNPSEEKNMNEIIQSIDVWLYSIPTDKTSSTPSGTADRYALFDLRLDLIITKNMGDDGNTNIQSVVTQKALNAFRSLSNRYKTSKEPASTKKSETNEIDEIKEEDDSNKESEE